jgi:hypothetical protein
MDGSATRISRLNPAVIVYGRCRSLNAELRAGDDRTRLQVDRVPRVGRGAESIWVILIGRRTGAGNDRIVQCAGGVGTFGESKRIQKQHCWQQAALTRIQVSIVFSFHRPRPDQIGSARMRDGQPSSALQCLGTGARKNLGGHDDRLDESEKVEIATAAMQNCDTDRLRFHSVRTVEKTRGGQTP